MMLAWVWNDFLSLVTLLFLEIVLGIDNLVFLSLACSKLPHHKQNRARQLGLLFALMTRLLLLSSATWLASFTDPFFTIYHLQFSGRDLILGLGGVFLLYKGTEEIHSELTHSEENKTLKQASTSIAKTVLQIAVLDIIFSLDSVITAIGMTSQFFIMVTAIVLSMLLMLLISRTISLFIGRNPSIKILALSFILMVGMVLIADSLHYHIPRGYVYFSIFFSLLVELLNGYLRNKNKNKK